MIAQPLKDTWTYADITAYTMANLAIQQAQSDAEWWRAHMGAGPNRFDLLAIIYQAFIRDDSHDAARVRTELCDQLDRYVLP